MNLSRQYNIQVTFLTISTLLREHCASKHSASQSWLVSHDRQTNLEISSFITSDGYNPFPAQLLILRKRMKMKNFASFFIIFIFITRITRTIHSTIMRYRQRQQRPPRFRCDLIQDGEIVNKANWTTRPRAECGASCLSWGVPNVTYYKPSCGS